MGTWFRWMAVAAGATAVTCAAEAVELPAPSPMHWRCWHSAVNADSISCRLAAAPADPVADETAPPPAASLRVALRAEAELEGGLVLIPLYGPPVDWDRVARLARVAMCGTRADCSVEFSRLPPG